jgi:hypothetical protein
MKLGYVILALLFLLVPTGTVAVENVTKKVLILDFNPVIESRGGKTIRQLKGWQDPVSLESKYTEEIRQLSGGYVNYQIVERKDNIDDTYVKIDGFDYSDESYLDVIEGRENPHSPDKIDYRKLLREYDICGRVNSGEIDEVWLWGGPWMGFYEAIMVGPKAYSTNAPPITDSSCQKSTHIMGFNYERGVEVMLEDFIHRAEGTMSFIYKDGFGGPTNWGKFSSYEKIKPGGAGCGWAHYPHNGIADYDYGNQAVVSTNCNDWLNYPKLTAKKESYSCQAWNCSHLGFMEWWLSHFPKALGYGEDEYLANWWKYLVDWENNKSNIPVSTYLHRDGDSWCTNHGGIAKTVDRNVYGWRDCLEWCDKYMNADLPLCQFNADGPRSCWVNYAPGGRNGSVNNCQWKVGGPPYGAWWIGFEPPNPTPTPTNTLSPTPIPESKPLICGNYGDVDNNSLITLNDSKLVEQYDVGLTTLTPTQLINADVNADGEVNVLDSLLIGRYAKGLILTFPVCSKIPGDANGDKTVNLVDLGIWKTEYVTKAGNSGDFSGDGVVNLTDLGIWKTEYVK